MSMRQSWRVRELLKSNAATTHRRGAGSPTISGLPNYGKAMNVKRITPARSAGLRKWTSRRRKLTAWVWRRRRRSNAGHRSQSVSDVNAESRTAAWTAARMSARRSRCGKLPPRFYPPDPKSGASANSATFARLDDGKALPRSDCRRGEVLVLPLYCF